MPNRLKYIPGTTRTCKACKKTFVVSTNRQKTGDFCSRRCGFWWIRAKNSRLKTLMATISPVTSPKGGLDSPSLPDVLAVPEAPLSQPMLDRN